MNMKLQVAALSMILVVLINLPAFCRGPLDPVRVDRWFITAGAGPGGHYFRNGIGLGPAIKGTFEAGMWDMGAGVITAGGEATFSYFNHPYGTDMNEHWVNMILGARLAYHYGWNAEGLDTYAGFPIGLGFCVHAYEAKAGTAGTTPVYPYAGFFIGASWFFNKTLGVNTEIGYGSTYATLGIIYRIK